MLYCGSTLRALPITGLVCIKEQAGYLLSDNLHSSEGNALAMDQVKITNSRLIQTMSSAERERKEVSHGEDGTGAREAQFSTRYQEKRL